RLLADSEVVRRADRDRPQLALGSANVQHGQVHVRVASDQAGLVTGLVRHRHPRGVTPLDYVEVGDDVAARVPDKARARPLRNLQEVEVEGAVSDGERG